MYVTKLVLSAFFLTLVVGGIYLNMYLVDLRFSWRWLVRWLSPGLYSRADLYEFTHVSVSFVT
jgi:hypothetical protein